MRPGTQPLSGRVEGRMRPRRALVVLVAAAAFAVSGCAGSPTDSPAADSAPADSTPAGSGSAVSVLPSMRVPSPAGSETLTGTVAEGVEPSCLILKGDDGHHVLIFDDPGLRSRARIGAQVTVSGHSMPGQATTCQQGVAFVVTAVRAN
jgi:hypothetical protein